jgi:2-dehydro-3-deoxygluconokinase
MSDRVVTFGEIMMRLSTPGYLRFTQASAFDVTYAGAECNVAVSLANYGVPVDFVTRLPDNDLGRACLKFIREMGVGTDKIVWGGPRLGVYFLETGVGPRGSKVLYDRADSAMALLEPGMIRWADVLAGVKWFHWTGITPSLSEGAAATTLEAVKTAKKMGLTVSCDLNYRAKLWKWGKPAAEVMPDLVAHTDVVVANEEDADKVFDIKAPGTDVTSGKVEADKYRFVCEELAKRFSNVNQISVTLRGSISASHNTWTGMLWSAGKFYTTKTYDIVPIVDRVGGGDSFNGGLIYKLITGGDPQSALDFAVAASCLKHTIFGDFNHVTVAEVEKLMGGDVSGRVTR